MTFMINGGVMTMSCTGGGMITATFHGITNGTRNIIVSTYSDGNGGYPFSIQVK